MTMTISATSIDIVHNALAFVAAADPARYRVARRTKINNLWDIFAQTFTTLRLKA
jgi:hypothetical protein